MRLSAATSRCVWCTQSTRPTTPTPTRRAQRASWPPRSWRFDTRSPRRVNREAGQDLGGDTAGPPNPCADGCVPGSGNVGVGSIGLKHFTEGRVGSTAATLVARAHCPVAMIRRQGGATSSKPGWVVVEVDESVDSSVLQLGAREAQLRGAPLQVMTSWRSRYTDIHDVCAASGGNRQVRARLDRSLACWRRRYPDLDLRFGGR
ncbi:MAG: hypothetical protein QOF25_3729 [Mycobacterium sp.]|nr:hypothetical protein [Mycobacterium sp.]